MKKTITLGLLAPFISNGFMLTKNIEVFEGNAKELNISNSSMNSNVGLKSDGSTLTGYFNPNEAECYG